MASVQATGWQVIWNGWQRPVSCVFSAPRPVRYASGKRWPRCAHNALNGLKIGRKAQESALGRADFEKVDVKTVIFLTKVSQPVVLVMLIQMSPKYVDRSHYISSQKNEN